MVSEERQDSTLFTMVEQEERLWFFGEVHAKKEGGVFCSRTKSKATSCNICAVFHAMFGVSIWLRCANPRCFPGHGQGRFWRLTFDVSWQEFRIMQHVARRFWRIGYPEIFLLSISFPVSETSMRNIVPSNSNKSGACFPNLLPFIGVVVAIDALLQIHSRVSVLTERCLSLPAACHALSGFGPELPVRMAQS